jgi:hypothetical protein
MLKFIFATIAISILLIAAGCAPNNQTVQERCTVGDPHPWCVQLAQTKPLGSWDSNGPTNPEMQEDLMPYPTNPALSLQTPGIGPIRLGR